MAWWWLGWGSLLVAAIGSQGLEWLISRERRALNLPPTPPVVRRLRPWIVTLSAATLCLALGWAEIPYRMVDSPEVQPSDFGRSARLIYHAVLCLLLVWASVIDLDCYVIPDAITLSGLVLGVGAAAWFQELQIAHLWVDWMYAVPQIRGPLIPEWYDQHRLWHALAWSLAGAGVGAGITQLVRLVSSQVLGQEAMGFGDVTFMAMIGSFLGWQAVVLTFALAPLTGLIGAIVTRLVSDRGYLPYGPCLASAAVIVLFNWSMFWSQTRMLFSDLWLILGVGAGALVALVVLLNFLRMLRKLPTQSA